MKNEPGRHDYPHAGMLRRLGAMFYDSLLLLSSLLVAIALLLMLSRGTLTYHNAYFRTFLFLVCFSFYAWFWTHGGQTLGLRTWRLRLQRHDGGPVTLWQALLRFMLAVPSLALCGLGFFWMLIDRQKLTLYDRFSRTRVVQLPKE